MKAKPFAVPQLHDNVEAGVEHHIRDEHGEEVGGEVGSDGAGCQALRGILEPFAGQTPVDAVHDQQEDEAVRVEGLEVGPVPPEQGPPIFVDHQPQTLRHVAVNLEPGNEIKLNELENSLRK